jgi:hypothetical protein
MLVCGSFRFAACGGGVLVRRVVFVEVVWRSVPEVVRDDAKHPRLVLSLADRDVEVGLELSAFAAERLIAQSPADRVAEARKRGDVLAGVVVRPTDQESTEREAGKRNLAALKRIEEPIGNAGELRIVHAALLA